MLWTVPVVCNAEQVFFAKIFLFIMTTENILELENMNEMTKRIQIEFLNKIKHVTLYLILDPNRNELFQNNIFLELY